MSSDREDGYTPIFDDVAQLTYWERDGAGRLVRDEGGDPIIHSFGLIGAAVFGIVWRHAQMQHKNCHCSLSTMSRLLGISTRSAQRWLKTLEREGMIRKIQPANLAESEPAHYVCLYMPGIEIAKAKRADEPIPL